MSGARFITPTPPQQSSDSADKVADVVSHLSINGNTPSRDLQNDISNTIKHDIKNNTQTQNTVQPVELDGLEPPPRQRQKSFRERVDESDIPDSPTESEMEQNNQNSTHSDSSSDIVGQEDSDICPVSKELQAKIDTLRNEIKQFRSQVQSKYSEKSNINEHNSTYVYNAIHDDEFVYRFLLARNKEVNKSLAMFTEAVEYRHEHHIDQILDYQCPHGVELHSLAQQFIHKSDKHGRPIIYEQVGSQDVKKLYAGDGFEQRCFYHQYYMEYLIRKYMTKMSQNEHQRVTQVVIVCDMKGLTVSQATKTNYAFVKYVAKVNSLLYPEYMAITYVINAPRLMSFMWNIVKGWLDEKTRNKISIIHGSGTKELSSIININDIPQQFGGQCNCQGCSSKNMQQSNGSQEFIQYLKSVENKPDPKHNEEYGLADEIQHKVKDGQ